MSLDDVFVPVAPLLALIRRAGGVRRTCECMERRGYRSYGACERLLWRWHHDPRRPDLTHVALSLADEVCTSLGTHIDLVYCDDDYAVTVPAQEILDLEGDA